MVRPRPPIPEAELEAMDLPALEAAIRHHNHLYWDLDRPEISDTDYDRLVERLRKLAPASPLLEKLGPAEEERYGQPVPHSSPMLSLDKCYTDGDLEEWAGKFAGEVLVTPKMDGIAAALRYDRQGRLVLAATRGRGHEGDDITANAKTIADIPHRISPGLLAPGLLAAKGQRSLFEPPVGTPEALEVRGEIYLRLSVFRVTKKDPDSDESFANPRNLAAGAIKQKRPEGCARYQLSFFAYDLLYAGLPTEQAKLDALHALGFPELEHRLVERSALREAYAHYAAKRDSLDFEIDGVVFKANRVDEQERLGSTAHHPRYAIAYKFQGESGTTTLEAVEWSVARTGAVTPVALIRPITLSGAQLSRASLHNAGFIDKLGLTLGAEVVVTRRGGVIPKIEEVAKPGHTSVTLPDRCPSCGGPLERRKDVLYCVRPSACRQAQIGAVADYCRALDLDGLGDVLLGVCYDSGILRTPADLYTLEPAALAPLKTGKQSKTGKDLTVGAKVAEKIVADIQSKRTVSLAVFLRALGIDDLGPQVSLALARHYGTFERLAEARPEEIEALHGFGAIMAQSIVEGLREKAELVGALRRHVTVASEEPAGPVAEGPLAGQSFVFTGALTACDRKTAQRKVQALGGETPSGVSRELSYLVVGDGKEEGGKGSKLTKAEKLVADGAALRIISEREFLALLGEK